jgi:predicted nucleic acid-binding protein
LVYLTIIDTDILIDAAQKVHEAVDCLEALERNSALSASVITQMELLAGCRNKTEQRHIERFLQRFQILKLTEQISDIALALLGRYRLSHGLAIPDALIAATAITSKYPLISKNQKDFRFVKGLQLLPYPPPKPLEE